MNRVIGGILMGIGILVAGLSGLCSLLVIASSAPTMSADEIIEGLPIVLIVGGIPLLIGLAAIWGGRLLMRTDSGEGPLPPPPSGDTP